MGTCSVAKRRQRCGSTPKLSPRTSTEFRSPDDEIAVTFLDAEKVAVRRAEKAIEVLERQQLRRLNYGEGQIVQDTLADARAIETYADFFECLHKAELDTAAAERFLELPADHRISLLTDPSMEVRLRTFCESVQHLPELCNCPDPAWRDVGYAIDRRSAALAAFEVYQQQSPTRRNEELATLAGYIAHPRLGKAAREVQTALAVLSRREREVAELASALRRAQAAWELCRQRFVWLTLIASEVTAALQTSGHAQKEPASNRALVL